MKKKVLSLALAMALCLALAAPVFAKDAVTIRNGETVVSDVDKDYPGEYVMNVTSEGDLRLDLRTDGGVHIELISSEGRHIAAQEYERDEGYGKAGKETDGSGKFFVDSRGSSKPTKGHFVFHVKPGVYRIILSTPFYLSFTELTATVLTATATPNQSKVLVNGREMLPCLLVRRRWKPISECLFQRQKAALPPPWCLAWAGPSARLWRS